MKRAITVFYSSMYKPQEGMSITEKTIISVITLFVLVIIPAIFFFR